MKVFEFGAGQSREWVVASDLKSAIACLANTCDMFHEVDEGADTLTVKALNEEELLQNKYDPDPEGTGEFDKNRAISFKEALTVKVRPLPFLLCSYID